MKRYFRCLLTGMFSFLLLASSILSCIRCSHESADEKKLLPLESTYQIPLSLEEARALHLSPETELKIEKIKEAKSGGSACGHAAVCVLIPLLSLLPDKEYDQVTLLKNGKEVFVGLYEEEGSLKGGTYFSDGFAHQLKLFELPALGKRVLLEEGRSKIDSSGKWGDIVKLPLASQFDLLKQYQTAIRKETDAEKRFALWTEMDQLLGDESKSFFKEFFSDPKESDEHKASLVKIYCSLSNMGRPDFPSDHEFVEASRNAHGPQTAVQALRCYLNFEKEDIRGVQPFASTLIKTICEAPDSPELPSLLDKFAEDSHCISSPKFGGGYDTCAKLVKVLKPDIEACTVLPRKILLKSLFDLPVSTADSKEALSRQDVLHSRLQAYLEGKRE